MNGISSHAKTAAGMATGSAAPRGRFFSTHRERFISCPIGMAIIFEFLSHYAASVIDHDQRQHQLGSGRETSASNGNRDQYAPART
ncbi:MAG TPA: hypothetical protein VEU47_09435 [Candidatus Cybelea sp.]|nr:hypothetical protein [Candidatus Cybelea sp.]